MTVRNFMVSLCFQKEPVSAKRYPWFHGTRLAPPRAGVGRRPRGPGGRPPGRPDERRGPGGPRAGAGRAGPADRGGVAAARVVRGAFDRGPSEQPEVVSRPRTTGRDLPASGRREAPLDGEGARRRLPRAEIPGRHDG